jgi:hypothetical protein
MNKQEVRSLIKGLINRTDCTDNLANQYIALAEKNIQRGLRLPFMEKGIRLTGDASGSEAYEIPSDYIELVNVASDTGLLVRVSLDQLLRHSKTGSPKYFSRDRGYWRFRPFITEGEPVVVTYYAELPSLIADTDSTILSQIAPDLLAYTTASLLCDYFVDDRKANFTQMAQEAFSALQMQFLDQELSGGETIMQPSYKDADY